MTRRPLILSFTVLLLAGRALAPACDEKDADDDGHLLFVHLRTKDIRESTIVAEVKKALTKSGTQAEWDELEGRVAKETGGIKLTDIDSVTACLTEFGPFVMPRRILIVTTAKPIDKAALQNGTKVISRPDADGFHTTLFGLVHFPDEKTFVFLDEDLKQKYLDGYARNRTGWPMTPELSRAAAGHTLLVTVNPTKLPKELLCGPEVKEVEPFLTARAITLTADLKGRELSASARAAFPDAAAAGKAKATVQKFVGLALGEIDHVLKGKGGKEFTALMPAVKEANRALKDAKVEVSGSELIVSGSYKADFDVGPIVAEAANKVRATALRIEAANNLKKIGIALWQFSDVHGGTLPVHAIGAKGAPLKDAKDKPLLSWRVAMLPYIEQNALYNEFKLDEPWDSLHNKKLIKKMPKLFAPPKPDKPGYTHSQMVIGPNALSPVGTRIPSSFPDGTSNTIAVVEAAEPVIWTKPDDVMLPGKDLLKDFRKRFGGLHPGGFNVVMWDGSVRFVKDSVSDRTLGLMLDPQDGQPVPDDW